MSDRQYCAHGVRETEECPECGFGWTTLCGDPMCRHARDRHLDVAAGGGHPCLDCVNCRGFRTPSDAVTPLTCSTCGSEVTALHVGAYTGPKTGDGYPDHYATLEAARAAPLTTRKVCVCGEPYNAPLDATRAASHDWQSPEWTEIIHLVSDGMTLNCDTRPDCGGYTDHGNAAHNMVRSALGERLPWLSQPDATAGEDAVDLAALLHDNGFQWDDANAVNAVLTHHGLVVRHG